MLNLAALVLDASYFVMAIEYQRQKGKTMRTECTLTSSTGKIKCGLQSKKQIKEYNLPHGSPGIWRRPKLLTFCKKLFSFYSCLMTWHAIFKEYTGLICWMARTSINTTPPGYVWDDCELQYKYNKISKVCQKKTSELLLKGPLRDSRVPLNAALSSLSSHSHFFL